MKLFREDQEKLERIVSEMYDNDLNPEIETTKYQPYFDREDDDGVDWYRAERQHLKNIYKTLSDNGSNDVQLSDYIDLAYKFDPEEINDVREFFEFAFDLPKGVLNKVNRNVREVGLDGRHVMSDDKINELLY